MRRIEIHPELYRLKQPRTLTQRIGVVMLCRQPARFQCTTVRDDGAWHNQARLASGRCQTLDFDDRIEHEMCSELDTAAYAVEEIADCLSPIAVAEKSAVEGSIRREKCRQPIGSVIGIAHGAIARLELLGRLNCL